MKMKITEYQDSLVKAQSEKHNIYDFKMKQ